MLKLDIMSLLDLGSLVGKKNATTTVDLSSRKPIDNQVSAYDFLFKKNKAALEPRTELVLGTPLHGHFTNNAFGRTRTR